MKIKHLMLCSLFLILINSVVYGRAFYDGYPCLYETFTYDIGSYCGSNDAVSLVENGVGNNGKCAFVEAKALNSITYPVSFEIGKEYKFSVWIKYKDRVPSVARLRMCMFFGTPDNPIPTIKDGVANDSCKLYKSSLTTDTWYYYEWTYKHTGYAKDGVTEVSDNALLTLRPAESGEASVNNPFTYYVDDLRMEEIVPASGLLNVSGGESVGETLDIKTNLEAYKYMFRMYRNTQDGMLLIFNRLTNTKEITYRLTEEDANQTLTFECIAIDTEGNLKEKEEYITESVYQPMGHLFYLKDFTDSFGIGFKGTLSDSSSLPVAASYCEGDVLDAATSNDILSTKLSVGNTAKLFIWDEELVPKESPRVFYEGDTFVYVDPQRQSEENTFATIAEAKEYVRELLGQDGGTIYVVISPGEHILTEPLTFTEDDCGKRKVVYTSFGDEKAKLSGGLHVEGEWTLKDKEKNIYEIDIPAGTKTRQLFVDGVRGQRARSNGTLNDCTVTDFGHTSSDTFLKDFAKIKDLEMVYSSKWINMRCGVQSIEVSDGVASIVMDDGWGMRPTGQTRPKIPEYYENAYELLDEEGEWYLDEDANKLYYIPRAYEDIHTADVVIPVLERLVDVQGSYDKHIKNLAFENLEFCYTTWMRPSSEQGYFVNQNNTLPVKGYETEGSSYSQHVDGVVELFCVDDIDFRDCRFSKLGTTALKMIGGISYCDVVGNEFVDNSAGAIVLGQCGYSYGWSENVRPDKAYPNTAENYYVQYNNITDNYIHTCSVDYKSASAISLGYPRYTNVSRNEIFDVPYTGIHIGWGWSSCVKSVLRALRVENNYIHNILNQEIYDGGAIYTLGSTDIGRNQKNENGDVLVYDDSIFEDERINILRGNYMVDIKNRNGPMYNDSGSSGYLWEDNVVDISSTPYWYGNNDGTYASSWYNGGGTVEQCALKAVNTYSTTDCLVTEESMGIPTEDFYICADADWPAEAQMIIENSGISQPYLDKFGTALQEVSVDEYYCLNKGESKKISIKAKTRKGRYCSLDGAKMYWYSSAPDVISVVNDGTVTAHKSGKAQITAYILLKDKLLKTVNTTVYSDQDFEVELNTDAVGVVKGDSFTVEYSIRDISESDTPLTDLTGYEISMTTTNPAIATVNSNGKITGVFEGITMLNFSVSHDHYTIEKKIPVRVYGEYTEEPTEAEFFEDYDNWSMLPADGAESDALQNITPIENGISICTKGGAAVYNKSVPSFFRKFTLNMNTGIYISFRQNRSDKSYRYSQCYFLWMQSDRIQLDRSHAVSSRTKLAGGTNIPFSADKFGQDTEVQFGCLNVEEGVRIIVKIDGKTMIDTIDCRKDALTSPGFMMIHTLDDTLYLSN